MSMDYVRRTYGVPAKRGGRVRLGAGFARDAGREGVITSATHHVHVRLDGDRRALNFHPTWELTYLDAPSPLTYDPARDTYTVPAEGRDATDAEVREYHRTMPSETGYGWTDDGMYPYLPGVQCSDCGRFVGRDGSIEIEHFEMSNEVSSVGGTCRRCLVAASTTTRGVK